jgi:hypothetical protein
LEKPFLEPIAVLESGGKCETMEGRDFEERPEPGSGWIHYFLYFHELASSMLGSGMAERFTMRRIQNATDGEL